MGSRDPLSGTEYATDLNAIPVQLRACPYAVVFPLAFTDHCSCMEIMNLLQ